MNSATGEGNDDLRYAEYVLGVLDGAARAAVAEEIRNSDGAAAAARSWEARLSPLTDAIVEVAPAPFVWLRICDILQLDAPARPVRSHGLWNNLPLWRWIGIGASAVAAALLIMVIPPRPTPAPVANSVAYMVSIIQADNGVTGWTATMDVQHSRMVLVPVVPTALAEGRAAQLWLIPAGQKPISVGMITPDKPTTLALDPVLLARLGPTAALAVSVEPIGGSLTGQPTGPVIAKGAISL
jgi:anti-sigma-K factor RskA